MAATAATVGDRNRDRVRWRQRSGVAGCADGRRLSPERCATVQGRLRRLGDDAADILVTDGLQDGELPSTSATICRMSVARPHRRPGPASIRSQSSSLPSSITKRPACLRHRPTTRRRSRHSRTYSRRRRRASRPGPHARRRQPGRRVVRPLRVASGRRSGRGRARTSSSKVLSVRSSSTKTGIWPRRSTRSSGFRTVEVQNLRSDDPEGSGPRRPIADREVPTAKFGGFLPETGDLASVGAPIRDGALLPALQLEGEVDFEFDYQVGDTQTRRRRASTRPTHSSARLSVVRGGLLRIVDSGRQKRAHRYGVVGCSPASTAPSVSTSKTTTSSSGRRPRLAAGTVLAQVGVRRTRCGDRIDAVREQQLRPSATGGVRRRVRSGRRDHRQSGRLRTTAVLLHV